MPLFRGRAAAWRRPYAPDQHGPMAPVTVWDPLGLGQRSGPRVLGPLAGQDTGAMAALQAANGRLQVRRHPVAPLHAHRPGLLDGLLDEPPRSLPRPHGPERNPAADEIEPVGLYEIERPEVLPNDMDPDPELEPGPPEVDFSLRGALRLPVGRGDTVEGIARAIYGENWRRGASAILDANRLQVDRRGNPILRMGQDLLLPDLTGFETHDSEAPARVASQPTLVDRPGGVEAGAGLSPSAPERGRTTDTRPPVVVIGGGMDGYLGLTGPAKDYARRQGYEFMTHLEENLRQGAALDQLRKHLGPDGRSIILIGHSWGGPAAYRLAEALHTEGIEVMLVTVDPVGRLPQRAASPGIEWYNIEADLPRGDWDRTDYIDWLGGGRAELPVWDADAYVVTGLHHGDLDGLLATPFGGPDSPASVEERIQRRMGGVR